MDKDIKELINFLNVLTDSFLMHISDMVHQINFKIPYRRSRKCRIYKSDLLRIDDSINLDEVIR